jgi:hypothetical protein
MLQPFKIMSVAGEVETNSRPLSTLTNSKAVMAVFFYLWLKAKGLLSFIVIYIKGKGDLAVYTFQSG